MAPAGSFVPLTLGHPAEGETPAVFRACVIKNTEEVPFQPLSSLLPPPAGNPPAPSPKVELERNGRTITRIRITCACGQVIELDCRYDTKPA